MPATVQEPRAVSIDDESLAHHAGRGHCRRSVRADRRRLRLALFHGRRRLLRQGRADRAALRFSAPQRLPPADPGAAIARGAVAFSYVTAAFEHELLSFEQDDDGVALLVRQPDGSDVGSHLRLSDRLRRRSSGVRKALGIALGGSTFAERWLIVDLENSPTRVAPHRRVLQRGAALYRAARTGQDPPLRILSASARARRGFPRIRHRAASDGDA